VTNRRPSDVTIRLAVRRKARRVVPASFRALLRMNPSRRHFKAIRGCTRRSAEVRSVSSHSGVIPGLSPAAARCDWNGRPREATDSTAQNRIHSGVFSWVVVVGLALVSYRVSSDLAVPITMLPRTPNAPAERTIAAATRSTVNEPLGRVEPPRGGRPRRPRVSGDRRQSYQRFVRPVWVGEHQEPSA
jgi:hypothetical protein